MKIVYSLVVILGLSSCATTEKYKNKTSDDNALLAKGSELVANGSAQRAINEYLDPIIDRCNQQKSAYKGQLYAARDAVETISYLGLAGAAKTNAQVVSPTCPDALYMKAYASVDLGRLDVAVELLNQALEWSPLNSSYLSELGHIYQTQGNWSLALEKFSLSEDYASSFSPESVKSRELSRAKRGVGFALIELGRLDDAEKKFRECLELDANDKKALNEIEYIKQLRSKDKKPQ